MKTLYSLVVLPHEQRCWLDVIMIDEHVAFSDDHVPAPSVVAASCRLDQYELDTVFLAGVHVRSDLRRRGIATALIHNALLRARADGKHAVSLYCKERNVAALQLYRSLGFVRCHRDDDAHFMSLQLQTNDALLDAAKGAA